MRDTRIMNVIKNSGLIKTWLYLSEDNAVDFTVKFHVGGGFMLDLNNRLTMDDDGNIMSLIGEAENPMPYDDQLDVSVWEEIINQLSQQRPVDQKYASRLEEIVTQAKNA